MLAAFALGALAQSSLLIAGVLVSWVTVPQRIVGVLAGFGAGALIASVSFDLLPEARAHIGGVEFAVWMLVGVGLFLAGDQLIEQRFASGGVGGALGIVVGSVVDGIPESTILGIQVATGLAVSASFLAAVFVSNIPQAIAPSADLVAAGWGRARLAGLWLMVVLACGGGAAVGAALPQLIGDAHGDRIAALAAGGILAMLTDSLMPFAFERGGIFAGAATAIGFCLSVIV
jgi:zinc transporter, ZIP family